MSRKEWIDADIDFLKSKHEILTCTQIAEELDRSKTSVYQKMHYLGISRKTNPVSVGEVFGKLVVKSVSEKKR